MAIGSSILTWRISRTVDPGELHTVRRVEKESDTTDQTHSQLRLAYSLSPWDSLGKNTGVGSLSPLQGIFLTQVSCIAGRFFTI